MGLDRRHEDLVKAVDEQKKKTQFQLKRLEKDLSKKEENFLQGIDRSEKNMTTQFSKLRVDVENVIQKSQVKSDTIGQEMQHTMAKVNSKLAKMDDSEEVKRWVQDSVLLIDKRLREDMHDYNDRFSKKFEKLFNNFEGIGEKEPYSNIKDYIEKSAAAVSDRFETLERHTGN